MLQIVEVRHGTAAYWETVALREAVLRKPLGLAFTPEQLAAEAGSHHLAAYLDGVLVGCLMLCPKSGGQVQMRQVAVTPARQRQGIGTAMVAYSEQFARQRGYTEMWLHARDRAVRFYEKLGYRKIGEPFIEVTIPHWEMGKDLRLRRETAPTDTRGPGLRNR